ncbi:hypothetical protein HH310_02935 [Actinoplanes sp. TBRC 11911]|uniref:hypothetical protein n=1 Tax=Actinoplanes sp. TBRC 11911 TaxID=2729386 RepID=UPI00145E422B|nr:hypothetical protein [Actinoplanes sp. TBRC 11911]NMO50146.1 hypothetical protein [Actinoplanes sp. TBRC 11911]
MFEPEADRLVSLLRERWGDEPGWALRANGTYGFFLLFRTDLVPIGEVRDLIVDTFGFASGPTFILGHLYDSESDAS